MVQIYLFDRILQIKKQFHSNYNYFYRHQRGLSKFPSLLNINIFFFKKNTKILAAIKTRLNFLPDFSKKVHHFSTIIAHHFFLHFLHNEKT